MKKILFSVALILAMFMPLMVKAEDKVNVYVFVGRECAYCARLEEYLNTIKEEKNLNVIYYETWYNSTNLQGLKKAADYYKIEESKQTSVPLMVIGSRHFSGYADYMNPDIERAIDDYNGDDQSIVLLVADLVGLPSIHGSNISNSAVAVVFILIVLGGVFLFAAPKKKV